jgi:hypothetical protein
MTRPGSTTPLQPVRPDRGLGPVAVGLIVVAILGVIVWQPWSGETIGPGDDPGTSPRAVVGSPTPDRLAPVGAGRSSLRPATLGPTVSPDPAPDSDLFAGPTTGPWSGRVAGEWSIVAFLRPDPVSRDPLDLRQAQVAVFVGLRPTGPEPGAICEAKGTSRRPAAANLPTRSVFVLGIAFPADRQVFVDGVYRLGGSPLGARPVELGRVPGDGTPRAAPAASAAATGGTGPAPSPNAEAEPVRMFALPDGGAWPDGVYRFDVYTRDGLPGQLFACIRP